MSVDLKETGKGVDGDVKYMLGVDCMLGVEYMLGVDYMLGVELC